ncbi:DNA-methyltransferase [Zooshikella sp. RANM57]|uniref:DNA-methyltransferase n=1 Tax=Zooshikella sp. RANM57 TaxID=3425863 RepID=UPI003D6F729E
MTSIIRPFEGVTLYNDDCRRVLAQLPSNSVDLIATDPPYFKVKRESWDNQWSDKEEFFAWLDDIFFEFYRVLKPSGSLYVFCSDKLAANTEVLVSQRFNVLNHIVWRKENGIHKKNNKSTLRRYCTQTERIIFAEHYNSEGFAKGRSGYDRKCSSLKANVFEPLISYFRYAKKSAGVSSKQVNDATGTQMCSHWFSSSQWMLPSEEQYLALQKLFKDHLSRKYSELIEECGDLNRNYMCLRKEYDFLRSQYESLRRPFSVDVSVPYTDVWDFDSVQYYPGKHPCEKPLPLMKHIVSASSRSGMTVLDPFLGSGSTAKACINLSRNFIGIEFDELIFSSALQSLRDFYEKC